MPRLRLLDYRLSRGPSDIGILPGDLTSCANAVNTAQRRLLLAKEAGDEGWYGTWAEMVFNVSRTSPYITCPRGVARLEVMTVCDYPVPIQNQFFEYLDFGNGNMPKRFRCDCPGFLQGYQRNNAVTYTDMTNAPQKIAVFTTDIRDAGRNVLIQGISNSTGEPLASMGGSFQVPGEILQVVAPGTFVSTAESLLTITGLQKDPTYGQVQFFQMDPTTGAQSLIHIMEPSETVAGYQRYYIDQLPDNCCGTPTSPQTIQVKAIVKLDLVPVQVDPDYLVIQNLEAIIEETIAARYSPMDTVQARQFEAIQHKKAIRLLQGELVHFLGSQKPAINFAPFGSAKLSKRKIGALI